VKTQGIEPREARHRYFHLAVPLLLLLYLISTKVISPSFYKTLVIEDGPIEYATAVAYFIGCFLGLSLARRLTKRGLWSWAGFYTLMSVGFLFIAMEEISWGQRIFHLSTPAFFEERNIQEEIGIHNMSGFRALLHPAYMVIGFVGAFGSLILSGLGVPKPVLARLLPSPDLFLYFLPCFLFYLTAEVISPFTTVRYLGDLAALYGGKLTVPHGLLAVPAHILDALRDLLPRWRGMGGEHFTFWRHQEPMEFLLSLGFLFFTASLRDDNRSWN
jgi:hypothetical protein